jgi:hypothetical protein
VYPYSFIDSKASYEEARQVRSAFHKSQRMLRSSASHGRSRKTRDSVSPRLADLECQTPPGCKANGMIEARVEVKKATKPALHGKRKE